MEAHAYTASFGGVAVTLIQDMFELLAAAGVPVDIVAIRIGQSTDAGDTEAEMLRVQISRVNATVTSGSGGTAVTPRAHSPASPAASTTVEANNTTQATTTTTIDPVVEEVFNVQTGWLYQPMPVDYIRLAAGATLVVELPVAPADSITMSGSITFVEYK